MPPPPAPFYLDWQFWSAIAAWVALGFALAPYVIRRFKGAKLRVDPYSTVALAQGLVGRPRLGLHLLLTNVGGHDLRVTGMRVEVVREGGQPFLLTGVSYFRDAEDKTGVLFTAFRLKRDAEWVYAMNFHAPLDRSEERLVRTGIPALHDDIRAKRQGRPDDVPPVEAAERLWRPLYQLYQANFKWKPGEFRATLFVDVEPKEASVERTYRFTIFESDSQEIERSENDYVYGLVNLSVDQKKQGWIFLPLVSE